MAKKSQGQGNKPGAGAASPGNQTAGACKLHDAIASSVTNLLAAPSIDKIIAALKQDVTDGKHAAINEPVPSLGYTALQHAIRSGASQLVKRLLDENAFNVVTIDEANKSSGRLSLLHEAVRSDNEDVLEAVLEAPCAKDFAHVALEVEIGGKIVSSVTPAVYLALLPLFSSDLSVDADEFDRRASKLEKLIISADNFGYDCGPRTFHVHERSAEISAIAVAALLCHALPMHRVLLVLATKFASKAAITEVDAMAVSSAAKALEPICPDLIEKASQGAAAMVTSPPAASAIPPSHAFWLSAPAALLAAGKIPTECGFDDPTHQGPSFMAVHTTAPPEGLELPRMLPSQFCTFWACLNAEFAASEASVEAFKASAGAFGLEALYLARAIPHACPLRQRWLDACTQPASGSRTLGSILAANVYVPSPLKLTVAPSDFDRVWFPGCTVAGGVAPAGEGGADGVNVVGDAAEPLRSTLWQKFMLGRDVPVLSAILAEGMRGDGKVVQALLATATEADEDEAALKAEVYDSCNSVPDAVAAALQQAAAAEAPPAGEWRIEALQEHLGSDGKPLVQNCTCVPILEFVQSVNRWEDPVDARAALEALVCTAPTLSRDALLGEPICNLMPWTTDLLPVPGSAAASPDGRPSVPGAETLNSSATDETVTLGRALVFAANGVIPGRAPPDPGAQKTAPLAFKVLQWLLNMREPPLVDVRDALGFPYHVCGLNQATGDLLIEALCGLSPDVLHLLVQFICEHDFQASAPWARGNLTALPCFAGWPEGAAAVLAEARVDPLVPISPAGDTPLHWVCKAGSCWASGDVNGASAEVDAEIAALYAPGPLQPKQVRGLVTELAAYKDGEMANAVDCARRTPLFYAHSAEAIDALLDAGVDVNARDADGMDCVAFRITESMAEDSPDFDLSIKDQIRLIVAHPEYNHVAHFKMKSENAEGGDGKENGAVGSHVERFARDHCPQDPEVELIIRATGRVKDLFMMRLPEMPRSRLVSHVKTWVAFLMNKEFRRLDLNKNDLLLHIEKQPPNLRKRFLSAFADYCKFPKTNLDTWDAESAEYFMQKFAEAIDDGSIPLHGHHHTICFAGTFLDDVLQRFGREALRTVLAFKKADWDEALAFMVPACQCDDPEHDHPPVTIYEFLKERSVVLKELPDPKNEKPGCSVPLAQKKKHKLLPAVDEDVTQSEALAGLAGRPKAKSGFKRGFFGKAPEKVEAAAAAGKEVKVRPPWVEKCSNYGSDVLKGVEPTEMRKRLAACMNRKEAKAKDENGAIQRLFAFYDSSVDARAAPLDEVRAIAMPSATKPSFKFAKWLKDEGNALMQANQKTAKKATTTLGAPIPDGHKFQALKCSMYDGAWTMYYLSSCMLLDVMANGNQSLGKETVATAGEEYCKCLSNMAQACIDSAKCAKDAAMGDKVAQTHAREQLMSAVATATAALGCPCVNNVPQMAAKSRKRVKEALSMLADDTQSEQAKQASKNIDTYVTDKEKEATPA
eukprot:jgi/Ulvmu1/170/UM001_0174.1